MRILEDGLHSADDYPADQPVLTPPPKPVPHYARPVPDALNREQYLAIGRPMLIAAGFLRADGSEDAPKPALPPMPDTPRKAKRKAVAKVKAPEPEKVEPTKGDGPCPF